MMLNIRGMSIVENFLTGVNRFGQGLTGRELSVIPHGADLPPDGGTAKFHPSWWVAGTRVRDDEVAAKQ